MSKSGPLQWSMLKYFSWAVVVTHLVEWLLPTLEVLGSNPVNGKNYIEHLLSTCQLYQQEKIYKRGAGNAPLKQRSEKPKLSLENASVRST